MPAIARLREHPARRLADPVTLVDLDHSFAALPSESREDPDRAHIQKTLFRRGPITTAIFAFAKGASLPQHRIDGEAVLQCLSGRIHVHTDDADYTLNPGQLLCLAPDIPHDLIAERPTRLLLHVALDTDAMF